MSRRTLLLTLPLVLACGGGSEGAHAEHGDEHAEAEAPADRREHHGHGHGHGHGHAHGPGHFADAERYAEIFDAPDRDEWQRPDEVIALLELREGLKVADLGAGTGYFLPHLSGPVGESGEVVGLDIEPNMVRYMSERIAHESLGNARAAQCPLDGPGVEPGSLERVWIVETWHHFAEREAYARTLHASLRPGGMVLVVDFTREAPEGPPPEMRLPAETVMAELRAGGFTDVALLEEELPRQYVIRARIPE